MSTLDYQIVYVFAGRAFAGNPLAVVFGAQDLATEQLQAIAREFNL
jgi:trans-2,3-dihydro-3-hydroxyanthranilate isomerase